MTQEQAKAPTTRNTEAEIDAFAKDAKIDLGDADTKAEKVAVINDALAAQDSGDGADPGSDQGAAPGDDQAAPDETAPDQTVQPSPAVPDDAAAAEDDAQQEGSSTPGGEQRATAASGNAFDGAVTAGSSNLATGDDEEESDALVGVGRPDDEETGGADGVGAIGNDGFVDPGASNAEFSADVQAEKGAAARGAGSTPAAGPLDAPETGYSNEVGTESFPRDAYEADAGPRPEEAEVEDDTEIVGRDGDSIADGDLFTEPQGAQTFVFAKTRIYESYTYPNTHEKAKRLLFPEGARVGLAEAQAVRARVS